MTHNTGIRFSTPEVQLSIGRHKRFRLEQPISYLTNVTEDLGYGTVSMEGGTVSHGAYPDEPMHGNMALLTIVAGFETDLNTVPWWAQWRIDRLKYSMASLPHDYMLQNREKFPSISRKTIDRVYREALIDQGAGKTEVRIRYAGVRINSWWREEL